MNNIDIEKGCSRHRQSYCNTQHSLNRNWHELPISTRDWYCIKDTDRRKLVFSLASFLEPRHSRHPQVSSNGYYGVQIGMTRESDYRLVESKAIMRGCGYPLVVDRLPSEM